MEEFQKRKVWTTIKVTKWCRKTNRAAEIIMWIRRGKREDEREEKEEKEAKEEEKFYSWRW